MGESGQPLGLVRKAALLGACLVAFALRVGFSTDIVFPPDGFVNLQGTDSWYHYRVIDAVARNFPDRPVFDHYSLAPEGSYPRIAGLFDLAFGGLAALLGGGHAGPRVAATVSAWSAPTLAALLPIPVYLAGRAIFNPAAAMAAAWLIAILPGNLFVSSRLGFADHHVAEALLSALVLYLLARALVEPGRLGWSAAAGIALAVYLGVWVAGAFLVTLIVAAAAVVLPAAGRWGLSAGRLGLGFGVAFSVAELIFLCYAPHVFSWTVHIAMVGGALGLAAMALAADQIRSRRLPYWTSWAVAAVVGVFGLGVAAALAPEWFADIRREFGRLSPNALGQQIYELQPLFWQQGTFSLGGPWAQFTGSFLVGVPALVALCLRLERRPERLFFLIWSVLALTATISKVRFAYYLAVSLALLAGWAVSRLLRWRASAPGLGRTVAVGLALGALYLPNLPLAVSAARTDSGPSREWREAMSWLRESTEEPFGAPEEYYRIHPGPFEPPDSFFGVASWWSSGNWVIALGRRVPTSNGFQTGRVEAAEFFLSTDKADAIEIAMDEQIGYVVTAEELTLPRFERMTPFNAKIRRMAAVLGLNFDDFAKLYYRQEGDRLIPFFGYSPRYFRSLLVRLQTFDGQARAAESVAVVKWEEAELEGQWYRKALAVLELDSYEEAQRYVDVRGGEGVDVVSLDPNKSCVPLDTWQNFCLARRGEVKIFDVTLPVDFD